MGRYPEIVDRIQKEFEQGCMPDEVPYKETFAYYMFQDLATGLSSGSSAERWNNLERIYWLCEVKTLLPDVADEPCKGEVEKACLTVLSKDKDVLNRRHALEILANGYATPESIWVLQEAAVRANDADEKELALKILHAVKSKE